MYQPFNTLLPFECHSGSNCERTRCFCIINRCQNLRSKNAAEAFYMCLKVLAKEQPGDQPVLIWYSFRLIFENSNCILLLLLKWLIVRRPGVGNFSSCKANLDAEVHLRIVEPFV
ncbi:hypothetical protein QQP08_026991 [Theobroma cacao]|nr:hypothetical protein QQP08_026991 [Theobroma cacao]